MEEKEKSIDELIKLIKSNQSLSDNDYKMLQKHLDPKQHEVNNKSARPDRELKEVYEDPDTGKEKIRTSGFYKVNRITHDRIAYIINKAVAFACGNPLEVSYSGDNVDAVREEIEAVMAANKESSLNRRFCRALFTFREAAEIWYLEEDGNIRCHIVSPMYGDTLYPIVDRKRKMQGFAYSNKFMQDGVEVEELVYYTRESTRVFHCIKGDWSEVEQEKPKPNIWGKIPVCYTNQEEADFEGVLPSIYRLERSSSNLADSVDDNAFPDKLFKGDFKGQIETPGKGGKYTANGDADIKVVESAQGSNLIKLDLEENKSIVNTLSQTPDLSLENLKGLGIQSGAAMDRLFIDARLKVEDKREYLDEHFTRRYNIVKAMVCKKRSIDPDSIQIEVSVTPYVPTDYYAEIEKILALRSFMPQRYVIGEFKKRLDPSIDVDEIMQWIEEEQKFEYGGSLME